MLGHSGCGAVTGAVDAYLRPMKFWSRSTSRSLRSILHKIFVAVRESANGLKEVWGPEGRDMPGYREALIETAVCLNAAQAAFDLRQEIELAGRWEIEVLYAVYSLHNHQVTIPVDPLAPPSDENVRLVYAPTNPREFNARWRCGWPKSSSPARRIPPAIPRPAMCPRNANESTAATPRLRWIVGKTRNEVDRAGAARNEPGRMPKWHSKTVRAGICTGGLRRQ